MAALNPPALYPAAAAPYSVVVIGGSAGAIPALMTLLAALPAHFPLPILVVQHIPRDIPSSLPAVLGWRTRLRVKWAEDGEPTVPGTVHIAPPDRHLILLPHARLGLSFAARIGHWRPAVDALFLSAADVCGDSTVAVVLSGAMWDGAAGMAAIARKGGITIVQDEASSRFSEMPAAALDLGRADVFLTPLRIAGALRVLAEPAVPAPDIAAELPLAAGGAARPAQP